VLTLTDQAARAIQSLTSLPDLSDDAGLRIVATPPAENNGQNRLAVAVSDGPAAGDKVVQDKAVRVYLEPDAARALNDRQLDARITQQGDVQFLIGPQQ
jgi:iron-sulfur cluster assembly protein